MSFIEKSVFTTRHLSPDKRFSAWKKNIGPMFDITPASASVGRRSHNMITSYLIDNQIMFSGCSKHAQRFHRTPLKIASDGLDHYVLQTHVSGGQTLCHGRKTTNCKPGDLIVLDLADSYEATATDSTQRSLMIPRHLLSPLLTNPDGQGGRVLRGDSPLATLVVNHLKTVFDVIESMSELEASKIIQPTLLLVAGALNGSIDQVPDGRATVSVSLLMRAKAEIENSLQRDISAAKLGVSLNLSRSALYRLFEPEGGVRAYIQERRLRRSAEDLLSGRSADKRICDIAYTWGFASEAHYSRAFRARFGMTPGEARATRFAMYPAEDEIAHTEEGKQDYEGWLTRTLRI